MPRYIYVRWWRVQLASTDKYKFLCSVPDEQSSPTASLVVLEQQLFFVVWRLPSTGALRQMMVIATW